MLVFAILDVVGVDGTIVREREGVVGMADMMERNKGDRSLKFQSELSTWINKCKNSRACKLISQECTYMAHRV